MLIDYFYYNMFCNIDLCLKLDYGQSIKEVHRLFGDSNVCLFFLHKFPLLDLDIFYILDLSDLSDIFQRLKDSTSIFSDY